MSRTRHEKEQEKKAKKRVTFASTVGIARKVAGEQCSIGVIFSRTATDAEEKKDSYGCNPLFLGFLQIDEDALDLFSNAQKHSAKNQKFLQIPADDDISSLKRVNDLNLKLVTVCAFPFSDACQLSDSFLALFCLCFFSHFIYTFTQLGEFKMYSPRSLDWWANLRYDNDTSNWERASAPLEQKIVYKSHRLCVQDNISTKIEYCLSWTQSFPLAYRLLYAFLPHDLLGIIFVDYLLGPTIVTGFVDPASSAARTRNTSADHKFRFLGPITQECERNRRQEIIYRDRVSDIVDDAWLMASPPPLSFPPLPL
jgi:hypothetical protein